MSKLNNRNILYAIEMILLSAGIYLIFTHCKMSFTGMFIFAVIFSIIINLIFKPKKKSCCEKKQKE